MQAVLAEQEINEMEHMKKPCLNLRTLASVQQIEIVGESKVEFALLQCSDTKAY